MFVYCSGGHFRQCLHIAALVILHSVSMLQWCSRIRQCFHVAVVVVWQGLSLAYCLGSRSLPQCSTAAAVDKKEVMERHLCNGDLHVRNYNYYI